jgi:hypothetical protein
MMLVLVDCSSNVRPRFWLHAILVGWLLNDSLERKQPELTKPALVYRREQPEAPRTTAIQPIAWFVTGDALGTSQHPASDVPDDVRLPLFSHALASRQNHHTTTTRRQQ